MPLVLVHGLGLSHRYMMPTARRLAADFPVYVPDLPGFGESDHPEKTLDMPGLADGLASWMDAIGLDRAALLGNSHGCQVIIDFAARYKHKITRGIVQGPTTTPEERGWVRQFVRWRQNSHWRPREGQKPATDEYRKAGYGRVLKTFSYALKDRPEDKAPLIDAPMLVVRGETDPICRPHYAEQLAELMPKGRLVIIPDVAHTLVHTAPDALCSVSRSFLLEG
jgi:2-hydroxy-6-oxonona-2,4-dienedioate hydrolase